MKDKFTIEIILRQHLPQAFYKDCKSIDAFRNWLSVVMMLSMRTNKLKCETILLTATRDVTAFCLN